MTPPEHAHVFTHTVTTEAADAGFGSDRYPGNNETAKSDARQAAGTTGRAQIAHNQENTYSNLPIGQPPEQAPLARVPVYATRAWLDKTFKRVAAVGAILVTAFGIIRPAPQTGEVSDWGGRPSVSSPLVSEKPSLLPVSPEQLERIAPRPTVGPSLRGNSLQDPASMDFVPKPGEGALDASKRILSRAAAETGYKGEFSPADVRAVSDALRADPDNKRKFYGGGRMYISISYSGDDAYFKALNIIEGLK